MSARISFLISQKFESFILYTTIAEVNIYAFTYRLSHAEFFSSVRTNTGWHKFDTSSTKWIQKYIGQYYTEILEVNLFAFAYSLFHEDFSPIYGVQQAY